MASIQPAQQHYISSWHHTFVNYISALLSLVAAMENHPSATNEDKKGLDQIKMLLHGREVLDIERSLAEADIKQEANYTFHPSEMVRSAFVDET